LEVRITFATKAMHLDINIPVLATLVVIMPNLHALIKLLKSLILSCKLGSSMFFSLYGSRCLPPVSALEYEAMFANLSLGPLVNSRLLRAGVSSLRLKGLIGMMDAAA
jgi:hypothetical protein